MNRDPNSEADLSDPREESGRTQPEPPATERGGPEVVELGRGLPAVNASISLQRRATRVLALVLVSGVTLALLAWYYTHAWTSQAPPALPRAVIAAANADAKLPALPRVNPPPVLMPEEPAAMEPGSTPELPEVRIAASGVPRSAREFDNRSSAAATAARPGAGGNARSDRRLSGAVFSPGSAGGAPSPAMSASGSASLTRSVAASGGASSNSFSEQLRTPVTEAVAARRLPTRRLLLPRGSTIDCTLITAIDSSLAGLVTCLTATDTFSADGTVILLERGTTLVGETRGEVRAGSARVFIVWTEARTPTGVVASLDSPATDALGRAGVAGAVQRHFWERFGAAMLLSVLDGLVQAQSARAGGNTMTFNSAGSSQILGEVLEDTIGIAPTVTVAPGTRVQALVARDIDFRSVYELKSADAELF